VRADWVEGKPTREATGHLLSVFRTASDEDACAAVAAALNEGVSPASIWDAVLGSAGELLMRRPGIISLHAVTSANALRYSYGTSDHAMVRLMLLLQNAAFLPLFRAAAGKELSEARVDQLEAVGRGEGGCGGDLCGGGTRPPRRCPQGAGLSEWRRRSGGADGGSAAAGVPQGNDAHDYKFSSAVIRGLLQLLAGMAESVSGDELVLPAGERGEG